MPNKTAQPPVILIGAPRSGTSMLTRLLEALGLFVGKHGNSNYEARFFETINSWVVRQSGGHWDYPQPVHFLLENQEARTQTVDYIRFLLSTPRVLSFFGWRNYLRYRSPFKLDFPWGWKDPHNTLTLPLWLDVFPDARVLHIWRHGVDVARSLRVLGPARMPRTWSKRIYYRMKPLHWFRPKRGNFVWSVRCASLEGGFSLWEEYISEARQHIRNLGERAMEIKYEDFLAEPQKALRSLARFCDLTVSEGATARLAQQVERERAYAYQGDPELRAFADCVAERLKAHGY
ncbi:MAG: sulfotransferase [Acidobacteriota bacterium]